MLLFGSGGNKKRNDLFPIPHIILGINVLLQDLDYGLFAHACSNKDGSLEGKGLSFLCGLIEEHSCQDGLVTSLIHTYPASNLKKQTAKVGESSFLVPFDTLEMFPNNPSESEEIKNKNKK